MDFEKARFNMVEQQIRPWEVLDQRVLDLLLQVKREDFVLPEQKTLAFVDMELPLGNGSKMLHPKLEARIAQDVLVQPSDRILQVGTGGAYLTALLARLGQHVYAIDCDDTITERARTALTHAGIRNVTLKTGNGLEGLSEQAPFDVIVLCGSVSSVPDALKTQLAVGGRLFAITGLSPLMEATRWTRETETQWTSVALFETDVEPLQGNTTPTRFTF